MPSSPITARELAGILPGAYIATASRHDEGRIDPVAIAIPVNGTRKRDARKLLYLTEIPYNYTGLKVVVNDNSTTYSDYFKIVFCFTNFTIIVRFYNFTLQYEKW